MVESVDVVTVLGDLGACAATFYEHAVEGFGVASIAWTPERDTDDGDRLVHRDGLNRRKDYEK